MQMSVNGYLLHIGQLGPDFVIIDDPKDHPPTDAEITVWIDGDESRWNVHLPEGISNTASRTRIVAL